MKGLILTAPREYQKDVISLSSDQFLDFIDLTAMLSHSEAMSIHEIRVVFTFMRAERGC